MSQSSDRDMEQRLRRFVVPAASDSLRQDTLQNALRADSQPVTTKVHEPLRSGSHGWTWAAGWAAGVLLLLGANLWIDQAYSGTGDSVAATIPENPLPTSALRASSRRSITPDPTILASRQEWRLADGPRWIEEIDRMTGDI